MIVIVITATCCLAGCRSKSFRIPGLGKAASAPDSSVNNQLRLRDAASAPGWIKEALSVSHRAVVLTTKDEMEYLIAYQDPDAPVGTFIGFEITNLTSDLLEYPNRKVKLAHFTTNNGIYLHMPVDELFKIEGNDYRKRTQNGVDTYQYVGAPEDFLRRHHSQNYVLECDALDGSVSRIRFGFIGPAIPNAQSKMMSRDK